MPVPAIRSSQQQQIALATMLAHGKPLPPPPPPSHDQLVDAIFRAGAVEDVAINGRTLRLTVAANTPDSRCLSMARLLHGYDADITTIVLSRAGGRELRCATPSAPEKSFRDAVFLGDDPIALDTPNVAVINAAPIPPAQAIAQIRADAMRQKLNIEAVAINGARITLYYHNSQYFAEADALQRLTALLMRDAPPEIEHFQLIAVANGVPQKAFDVLRAPQERKAAQSGAPDLFAPDAETITSDAPMQNPILSAAGHKTYPRISWAILPQFRQQLFDPKNPFAVQFLAGLGTQIDLRPGFSINAEVEANLYDNFDVTRASNSVLPHVRSDFVEYFTKGKDGIGDLELDYRFRLSPEVYAVARGGYLESMFAGVGGEILWRPENQRWAVGIDGYQVWQRAFDRLFGLQKYSQATGHVSIYYASPWYNLDFAVHAGQYLAGDRGLTIEVTRRFETGVEIGAFITKTNVSAADFGEGSFDKGILIRIPLDWGLPINSQTQLNMDLRPIQRDGGQRLLGDMQLFEETRRTSTAEMLNVTGSASH
jgi:hypothetical protein